MNFKRLSLAKKIAMTPLIGVILVLVLSAIFVLSLNDQRRTLSDVAEVEFAQAIALDKVFFKIAHVHSQLHSLLRDVETEADEERVYIVGRGLIEALHNVVIEVSPKGSLEKFTDEDRVLYDKVRETVSHYQHAVINAIDMASLNWKLAQHHLTSADGYFVLADRDFHELSARLKQRAYEKLAGNLDNSKSALGWFVVIAVTASALMISVAWVFSRNLLTGINRVINSITMLAAGEYKLAASVLSKNQELASIDNALLVLSGKLGDLERETRQRRHAESELALAAKVFESANEGIVIADSNNQILAVNRAFSNISGFDEEEVVNKGADFFFECFDGYGDVWNQLEARGEWQGELFQRHKNGELRPVWLTSSRVHDEDSGDYHYVSVLLDIAALKDSQARIDYMAQHDALTGLPNRTLFIERLKHALNRARRDKTQLSVLFVDLDRFKMINDTHGHPLGDELLTEIARRITQVVRVDDTVARIGGDEFILLLEGVASAESAKKVARLVLEALSRPVILDGKDLVVTTSIGIATYPADGDDETTLIRNADTAMYQAKESGRDRFYAYTAELTADALRKFALETDLRQALARNQLSLHYQPQTSLHNNEITGFEALLRWQHPQRGWVSPAVFIPIAEDIGMIEQIGDWVLSAACRQASLWRDKGLGDFRISVNISARQLMNPNLVDRILALLKATNNPVDAIEIEVTESSVMEHASRCIAVLESLHKHGIPIAVDDFGTGYSSLSYLKRLPIQKVKIDRSFVNDLPNDPDDSALVSAIIAMAHSLGLFVVGEGVETVDQLEFLRAHGCDSVQGYYLDRPMSDVDIEARIKQQRLQNSASIAS